MAKTKIYLNKHRVREVGDLKGLNLKELADCVGVTYECLNYRLNNGFSEAEALFLISKLESSLDYLSGFPN